MSTFTRVVSLFHSSFDALQVNGQAEKPKQRINEDKSQSMSHTFMTLIITMAIYLPRESLGILFEVASSLVQRENDPQLQKKAYRLVSRLAESEVGQAALRERSQELGELILKSSSKVSSPARRDRLMAITRIVTYLSPSDLHFVPSVLSEVVLSVKEVNEKARTAAFDLLIVMGEKMKQGGTVVNSKVPHMPPEALNAPASLEEYFTMVSAGLAGSTPHMVSASITALTRLLYHFKGSSTQYFTKLTSKLTP